MLVVQQSDVQSACAIAIIGQLAPVKTEVVLTRVRALDAYVQIDVRSPLPARHNAQGISAHLVGSIGLGGRGQHRRTANQRDTRRRLHLVHSPNAVCAIGL